MFYHIPFLKGASIQPRSLSPSSRAVCFMQSHRISAVFMQIRRGSAARLAFHRPVCVGPKHYEFWYQLEREGEAGIVKALQRIGWD